MSESEKATELIQKFSEYCDSYNCAVRCAILTVDEILRSVPPTLMPDYTRYWKNVKSELQNRL